MDLTVVDPDGLTVSHILKEIPGAVYMVDDINGDGDPDKCIGIPERKVGDYLVSVMPEPGAEPSETYTLMFSAVGVHIVLAEEVQVTSIPSEGYIVRSTETGLIQIIPASIDFEPNTLNRRSKGQFVTVCIELPMGYGVNQIDISSIMLNGSVQTLNRPTEVGDHDRDGIPDLMVEFDRSTVQGLLAQGDEVEVTVSGELEDGTPFEGTDTI